MIYKIKQMKQVNWLNILLTLALLLSITVLSAGLPRRSPLTVKTLLEYSGNSGLELNGHKIKLDKASKGLLLGPKTRETTFIIDVNNINPTAERGLEVTLVLRAQKKQSMHWLKINEANESKFNGSVILRK